MAAFGIVHCALGIAAVYAQRPTAETAAVAYLSVEVPRWRMEHPCYSCHNNGDATRALIAASRRGLMGDRAAEGRLDETLAWLRMPERWALNSEDGGVKDLPLARIQFGSALQMLVDAGRADRTALDRAAALILADQRADGAWPIAASGAVGSPAAYGTTLATAAARRVLAGSTRDLARAAVGRADDWLRRVRPESVLDASGVLFGLERATDPAARRSRADALARLKQGQGPDGGWGPFVTSRSEPFDTALAILALQPLTGAPGLAAPAYGDADLRAAIARARRFLLDSQNPDGSWPETTRPAEQESYAQRISTTGWATLALLETGQ